MTTTQGAEMIFKSCARCSEPAVKGLSFMGIPFCLMHGLRVRVRRNLCRIAREERREGRRQSHAA